MKRSSSLQFSLRTLLVVLMPLAAAGALAVRWTEPRLVRTGNAFDLAIEGAGYICVMDEFRGTSRYTRGGKLIVNASGVICLRLEGEDLALSPRLTVLSAAGSELKINADGGIFCASDGSMVQLGQLELYTFPSANLPQFEQGSFAAGDELGTPTVWLAGTGPTGQLRQGYRELPGWRWDAGYVVTLLVGFVLGAVTTWLIHRNKSAVCENAE